MKTFSLKITAPAGRSGFAEFRRGFCVEGRILSSEPLPPSARLSVTLADERGTVLREVRARQKNGPMLLYHPDLTGYREELDPGHEKLKAFGFPPLAIEDPEHPDESLHKASVKAWFSDSVFKAIVLSAGSPQQGAVWDGHFPLLNDDGSETDLLPEGTYRLTVRLSTPTLLLAEASKPLIIGHRDEQLLGRFHPDSHKKRLEAWCKEQNIAIITENLPGYLDPYLGTWYYHMGLLPFYRAQDICLFADVRTVMFNYQIDPTSTSYETELGYLESRGLVGIPERFTCWYYDSGEAELPVGETVLKGTPTEFTPDRFLALCRLDRVNELAREGISYLDGRQILDTVAIPVLATVSSGERLALTGVLKPWQMDPADFVLRRENVYDMNNSPETVRFEFYDTETGRLLRAEDHPCGLERIDTQSIGSSIFEFYCLFTIDSAWSGKTVRLELTVFDRYGAAGPAQGRLLLQVV